MQLLQNNILVLSFSSAALCMRSRARGQVRERARLGTQAFRASVLAGFCFAGLVGFVPPAAYAGPFADAGHAPTAMLSWASEVEIFVRGPLDIASPGLGLASFGLPENALGESSAGTFDLVSLGDGGSATLYFEMGIGDGPGDDFAVYENGFFAPGGFFGEFAFVEVSTNGVDFARFAAESLHDFMVGGGEVIDPTDYGNFAGDQVEGLGTGFDLAELAGDALVLGGLLDLSDVRYVRVVDVVGDGSTLDALGFPVYDPYPTAFGSGGFDLEAVGVLHEAPEPGFGLALGAGLFALAGAARRRLQ
ncbi:MAG: PEP-CTERM sorting domain-containing protein [Myxococcota bacterium]